MKNKLLYILNLSVVSALTILGMSIVSPIVPQYALSFDIPVSMTGWAISSFGLARLFMNIPAGILSDKFGRKRNMFFGLGMILLSALVSGTASSYGWLILGRILQGFGSAIYVTSALTWLAEISSGEYRGRYMSLYTSLNHIFGSFGPALGGYSAMHFGLSGPFFVYGGLMLIGLVLTIPLKEVGTSSVTRSNISVNDVTSLLGNLSFILVSLTVFAMFMFRSGILSTLVPLYGSLNVGLNEAQIGIIMTVAAVTSILVVFPSGWLSDKVGRKIPMMMALVFTAVATLIIPLQPTMNSLLLAMALYGFCSGFQGSLAAWPADVAPKEKLGAAMGSYRVIGDLGHVLGPIAVTYVAGRAGGDVIPFASFVIPAALAIIVAIAIIWAKDPAAKRKTYLNQE